MMKVLFNSLVVTLLLGAASCTSLSETGTPDPLPNPDHNRRVQHSTSSNLDQVRKQMNQQSSESNRKLNIEESTHHGPATTPTTERSQRVVGAPIDSTSHRTSWPVRPRVSAGD
ncbi:hypothetical protein FVR03_14505 [Pontibacter qinzhouensis]|uniref:Uncharacterized protein n=1 Tax=Pontibacter qinzhouensis TaxID=2603253 RepID=A0A5C8JJU1_9BACT|nr:hypothetical protein [Pontibacter qinzhouensis]TXK38019.1 hypothetical protein FVR03_14505 [Pontibacter qinzhouensis]